MTALTLMVEVMGGIEPARTYIKAALEKGKHVVTANKDLMAMHGHELLELAGEHHCDLLFEAAVAGGIPIIRPLKQCLAGNNITEIMGYYQRDNKLHSDKDEGGWHGLRRGFAAGNGFRLCRGRPYGGY